MKRGNVTAADLASSVLAVPPLARNDDLSLAEDANRALIAHLQHGGVTTLMYGGNANFYNIGLAEYAPLLDFLAAAVAPDTWVIPSAGPDFGKLMDQARVLRERDFPTAMVLPLGFPATPDGVERGIRAFADAFGKPVIVYIKNDGYLAPAHVERLDRAGCVAAVKYAVVRADPAVDPFLAELVQRFDRTRIVSGIGERPAIVHLRDFGLQAFTSGSVCVAPRGSTALLAALNCHDYATAERVRRAYLPLEDLRDALSPLRVLHEAVTLAGIADMGPMLPMLSNLDVSSHPRVRAAATALLTHDRTLAAQHAMA
ncbi:MAG: dihydrodipicolinate synthase family protein [Betaproteobacteria bacterium]